LPVSVDDGRAAVVDGDLGPLLAKQDSVVSQADNGTKTFDLGDRIFMAGAGGFVNDVKNFNQIATRGLA
jgi:hypothetical protein